MALTSSVLVTGAMDTTAKISVARFRRVLRPLKIDLSAEDIKNLATILKTNSVKPAAVKSDFVFYQWEFLKGLRSQIMRLCGDEDDEYVSESKAFLDTSDSEEEIIEHLLREEEINQMDEQRELNDSLLNSDEEDDQRLGILERRAEEGAAINLKRIERSRSPSSPEKLQGYGGAPVVKRASREMSHTEPI